MDLLIPCVSASHGLPVNNVWSTGTCWSDTLPVAPLRHASDKSAAKQTRKLNNFYFHNSSTLLSA